MTVPTFTIQEGDPELWQRVVDTGRTAPGEILEPGREQPLDSARYCLGACSVVVLTRQWRPSRPRAQRSDPGSHARSVAAP